MRSIPGALPPDAMPVFELVLAEVLNNIVEHALAGQPDGRIDIDISAAAPSGLTCCIRDNGRAMPGGVLPSGDLPDICVDLRDMPEGGFGWHLIRSLTSDLTYRRSAGGNALSFAVSCGVMGMLRCRNLAAMTPNLGPKCAASYADVAANGFPRRRA